MKHKYADMHCFCSENDGAAVVVYWQCYPHLQNSTLENSWNHMYNSKGDWLLLTMNTEGEWQQCRKGDVLAAVCMKPQYKYTQSYTTTAVAETWVLGILHHDGFCLCHLCQTYDFANDCNHGCKICLTFFSWMRLNLPGMILPTQGICKLRPRKINTRQHSAIFKRGFHLTCGVEYWVITWLDHTSRFV